MTYSELQYERTPSTQAVACQAIVGPAEEGSAFQDLVQSYEAIVIRIALNLTSSEDDAQQIYCQVFKEAFHALSQVTVRTSNFVWIYRILVRHCSAYCRRRPGAAQVCSSGMDVDLRLHKANSFLPTDERLIFLLKQVQGLKIGILAEIFSTTPKTIEKKLRRAAARVRESFFDQSIG